jgi:hypothetical protein
MSKTSKIYDLVLAESGDPDLAARVAARAGSEQPLNASQARALQWLRDNDPTKHTGREIAAILGESSHTQVIAIFGSLVHRGYCRPTD